MNFRDQIKAAKRFGSQAYGRGVQCVPALDTAWQQMIEGRAVGVTPFGEATTIEILDAWKMGWRQGLHSSELVRLSEQNEALMAWREANGVAGGFGS